MGIEETCACSYLSEPYLPIPTQIFANFELNENNKLNKKNKFYYWCYNQLVYEYHTYF